VPTIHVNGIDVAYDVYGAGPPLVFLHGATSSGREDFAAQIPLFSRAFRIYVPDARGHARTRWDVGHGFRYDWLVDDLAAFVDALRIETFHLVGFSMGAMTGLQYAVRAAERLRTLTVVGITTQREPRASVARRLMDPLRVDREDPRWGEQLARRHDPGQGEGGWRRLLPAIAADVAVQPLLTPRDLRRITAPTLVACGDRDQFVPVDHAWGLSRQAPDGRLFVAPDCGHEVMTRRPGLFNEALAGFFRSTERTAQQRAEAVHEDAQAAALGPATATGPGGDPPPDSDANADDRTDVNWLADASR
jgi:pimeloyl-ACP methyl ester carboxylesterase